MLNLRTMLVAITILQCNKTNYKGKVKIELGTPGSDDYQSKIVPVFVQGLARFRILNEKWEGFKLNHRYVDENRSPDYDKNPFRLVWTIDKEGNDKYYLNLVSSDKETIIEKPSLDGKTTVKTVVWNNKKKKDYVRFLFPSREAIARKKKAKRIAETA